jgi:ribosome biogenesis GTPase A
MNKPMIIALTKTDLVSQQHTDAWVSFLKKRFPLATPIPFSAKAHGTDGKGGVAARRKVGFVFSHLFCNIYIYMFYCYM